MSEKRRDNKNRILHTGESQRKDGRYCYKYTDNFGEVQFVYAWKLVPTDKTPSGKRDDLSLREKEKQIQKDLDDGIDTKGKKLTVCQLYEKFTRQKGNVKQNTKIGRKYLMEILGQDKLGAASIESVKMSDAKEWAIRMSENGYAYKTIDNYKRSLKATFQMAVRDDYIRKNPFDFQMNTVLEDDTEHKEAMTAEQEASFLNFVENDTNYQQYIDDITILLGTGIRISEFCGLTDNEVDMENRLVIINHQLLKDSELGYYIAPPKTKSGFRQIPMSEAVYQAFVRVFQRRSKCKAVPFKVDGYSNFLFLNQDGLPKVAHNYESVFKGIVRKYYRQENSIELPGIMTPHTMRHTFCTNLANKGMNPKSLQYIMGHSNITMTLNYYAHASFDTAKDEMLKFVA